MRDLSEYRWHLRQIIDREHKVYWWAYITRGKEVSWQLVASRFFRSKREALHWLAGMLTLLQKEDERNEQDRAED